MRRPLQEVVAAAIYNDQGQLLLAQRAADGSAEAGLWEFPGGKVHAGERAVDALQRELDEELGLLATALEPIPAARCVDPQRALALTLWSVQIGAQRPQRRVHTALRWIGPEQCITLPLGHLDRQLARWAGSPRSYHISPPSPERPPAAMVATREPTRAWALARLPGLTESRYDEYLAQLIAASAADDFPIMLHDRLSPSPHPRVIGCHLSARLAAQQQQRPIAMDSWLAVSCHNASELEHAAAINADFVVLGPVRATPTHPQAQGIGWEQLGKLCAAAKLPVLALGGVSPSDLIIAQEHGCAGVAGISAFWR